MVRRVTTNSEAYKNLRAEQLRRRREAGQSVRASNPIERVFKSVNEELFDNEVDRAAMVRRYENKLNRDINNIYRDHREQLAEVLNNNERRDAILNKIRREVTRAHRNLYEQMRLEMRAFIIAERDFGVTSLEKVVGEALRIRSPGTRELLDLVLNTSIIVNFDDKLTGARSQTLQKAILRVGAKEYSRVESLIVRSLRDGLTPSEVADLILEEPGALKISRSQARTIVRTAVTEFSTLASEKVYEENADILIGYEYVATLDSRTTPICSALDGRVFKPKDRYRPTPPQHWNCRSTTTPVVKPFKDLEDVPQFRKNVDLDSRQRARYNGREAAKTDYDTWLRKQPRGVQLRHLDNREEVLSAFMEGVPLKKLVNTQTQDYVTVETLDKLRQRL